MKLSTFVFFLFFQISSLALFHASPLFPPPPLSLFVPRVCSFRWARLAFSFLVPEFLFFCLFQDWRVDEAETRGDCVLSLLHWKFFFFFPPSFCLHDARVAPFTSAAFEVYVVSRYYCDGRRYDKLWNFGSQNWLFEKPSRTLFGLSFVCR